MNAVESSPAPPDERRFYLVLATDKAGSLGLREQLRPAHRLWLREHPGHELTVVQGGPTLDEDGQMNGTLLIVEAQTPEQVLRFVEFDPYNTGGLFAQVVIRPWQWSLGRIAVAPPQAGPLA
jgi:uncharacterized protein YciI